MFDLIAETRQKRNSLKTVQTGFYGHHTPNHRGHGTAHKLYQTLVILFPALEKLSVTLKSLYAGIRY